jgi:hypothetical protein
MEEDGLPRPDFEDQSPGLPVSFIWANGVATSRLQRTKSFCAAFYKKRLLTNL